MAAPPEVSMQDFTGSWALSKPLSGAFDPVFAVQGIPWIIRKIISIASLSMKVEKEVDEAGTKILVFTQIASVAIAGLSEEREVRVLDGREKFHSSALFGTSSARSRMVDLSTAKGHDGEPLDPELTKDFLDEGEPGGENNLYDLIVHQTAGWAMEQVWGFGMVNGERRLMRTLKIKKGDRVAYTRAIFDWKGRDVGK
ncbi:uncharacterized protein N7484_009322 [Penicillium longicatenatum]|uniref:uncharacterized protein n=1 Tax=Penicillium longicatenatum TaxID=1561947 RepID=UPI0025469F78|nr:uncharacterized protein N7484_009322 [Penicillium longicatenatum]KAJ5636009.1 hypothetical protein N7484_009322 [Penicillium longicatenatum]